MADIIDDKKTSSTARIVGSDEEFAATVDSDQNLHVESHGNKPDGSKASIRVTGIVAANSTNTPLLADETFTGEWYDAEEYSNLTVVVISDRDSAIDGFRLEYSSDSINIDDVDQFSIKAINGGTGENRQFSFPIPTRYFRVVYINGAIDQTIFRLQTKVHSYRPKSSSHRIADSISDQNDAEVVKAVLTGQNPNRSFVNAKLDGKNSNMSSSVPLGIDGIFISPIENLTGYLTIDFTVFSDQNSAIDGIKIEWFADEAATVLLKTSLFSYTTAGQGAFFNIPIQGEYARLSYTNGGVAQSSFVLDSRFRITPNIGLLSQVESSLSGDLLAVLARSVLFGRTEDGDLNNVALSNSNSLKVAVTDRPSEVRNRTHVNISIPDTTISPAGTIFYTVTPGKTLHITSFLITQLNISASDGVWTLNDAGTVKSTFLLPARVTGSTPGAASSASPTMPEPMMFTTNLRIIEVAGDLRVAGYLIGYEE